MVRQVDIATHLDLSERSVRDMLKNLNLDSRSMSLDEIRIAYIRHLRGKASGHTADGGLDLVKERVLTERVTREFKQYELAEKKGQLVNVEQLYPILAADFSATRSNLLALADELKVAIDSQYGIDLELGIIEERIHDALSALARYDSGGTGLGASFVRDTDAA